MSAPTVSNPTAVVDPRTDPRWHALAVTEAGSVFTSPPWIRSICGTFGFTPEARIVANAEGFPTAGFAWVAVTDLRGDRLISMPFSDRAEPVVADPVTWFALADDALRGDAPLQIRCLDSAVPTNDTRFVRTSEAAWHCTPLGAPLAELRESLSSTARRNIATADRNGVHVAASTEIDAVRLYHGLHVALRKNKYRLLAQPMAFFERIWEEFAVNDGIVTLVAYDDGEPIAGAIYLIWNDTLYYKFGASLASTLPLRPNDALAWTALRWASERGLRRLDWGLSDLDQPGLISYKRKWASEERRIVTLRSGAANAGGSRDIDALLGELTRLFTDDAVPDHVTERAGSLLYRYFT
jgi:CelD/BcsL family acetyltransferase involved in cellulose biosynthesis